MHTADTRSALLDAARAAFGGRGYAYSSLDEIVAAADVSKGALYHHFRNKIELFAAVCEEIEKDLAAVIVEAAQRHSDPHEALEAGCGAFLDASLEPEVRRIVLLDSSAVLPPDVLRGIQDRYCIALVRGGLELIAGPRTSRDDIDALARLLFGALAEAARTIAEADDHDATRRQIGKAVRRLLRGLAVEMQDAPAKRRKRPVSVS